MPWATMPGKLAARVTAYRARWPVARRRVDCRSATRARRGPRRPFRRAVPHVQVLLSTYNGARHLRELLDSVLGQRGVSVEILVRDDGSTDDTLAVLDEYARGASIRVVRGANLGVVKSFFWLLAHASTTADVVALADQDDVWLPGKLARAAALLARLPAHTPGLYCSRLTLVDGALNVLGESSAPPRGPSFENSLVENIVTGCTAAINQAARAALARELPDAAHMHDWWMYQVIAGVGRVLVDGESHILYRQHGGNVVGAVPPGLAGIVARVRRVRRRRGWMLPPTQLRELRRIHGAALDPRRRRLLDRVAGARTPRARLALALAPGVVFQARWKALAFRGLVLVNGA